jgi:hypothetical protein
MTPVGVLWHSTGANNTSLKRYIQPSDTKPAADTYSKEKWLEVLGKNKYNNDWNHISRQAGLNCWIGKLANGTIATVQTMPWNYKPWGCGSGPKGSCNSGWIQFEIAEDNLTNKEYFNAVYKEACEITAYLCKLYNIDPKGTVTVKGVKVPTILCHKDAHKLGFGSNHGDVYSWFNKHGKSMEDVRNDVVTLLAESNKSEPAKKEETTTTVKKVYRVRKSWTNAASQKGAFANLANAKACCQKAGAGYKVYDWEGNEVYAYAATPNKAIVEEKLPTQAADTVTVQETLPKEPTQEAHVEPENHETTKQDIVPDSHLPSDLETSEPSDTTSVEEPVDNTEADRVKAILGLFEKAVKAVLTVFNKK